MLNPDPKHYWPLFGVPNVASMFLGPRRSGVGGNEALFRAISKVEKRNYISLNKTIERMFDHLRNVGPPWFGPVDLPNGILSKLDAMAEEQVMAGRDELWTISLVSLERGINHACPPDVTPISFRRAKLWAPFLASQKQWLTHLPNRPSPPDLIKFVRTLEFSRSRSARWALDQLGQDQNNPRARAVMEVVAFFYLLACFDADLDWLEGDSFFRKMLPVEEDGIIVPPMRRWMLGVQKTLQATTQSETSDILLAHQSQGDTRDREGKRLWSYGGTAQDTKERIFCPSRESFSKMLLAIIPFTESDHVAWLHRASFLVTAFTNLFNLLDDLGDSTLRMMIFDDYRHYFDLARNTKGPPPL